MRHVISVHDLSTEEIIDVLDRAEGMLAVARGEATMDRLKGKVLASIFFEPSTRTRLSFETAMNRLGGGVIGFSGTEATSVVKGETLADTIRMVSGYADAVVLRHPQEGAAKLAIEFSDVPIINAGDGAGQHPTQTLLDLFTIRREMGRLEGLNISLIGDLRFGRTTHSLAPALARFGNTINLVSPEGLEMPGGVIGYLKDTGKLGTISHSLEDIVPKTDVLYVTRIQKERFPDPVEYEKVAGVYRVDPALVSRGPEKMIIMHPLPRVNEIAPQVDAMPQAKYFNQAFNGVPVRMALLSMLIGGN